MKGAIARSLFFYALACVPHCQPSEFDSEFDYAQR